MEINTVFQHFKGVVGFLDCGSKCMFLITYTNAMADLRAPGAPFQSNMLFILKQFVTKIMPR